MFRERQVPLSSLGRFTDPGDRGDMIDALPEDVAGICAIAGRQTIHHNLLPYFGVPRERWSALPKVWPPRLSEILGALHDIEPHALVEDRQPEQRILGACMLESHFLAGILRRKGFGVRIRAGYFRNVRSNSEHVVRFWEHVLRERQVEPELLRRDPDAWRTAINAYTQRKNEIDHRIEHWICEYWDTRTGEWRLLDANHTFLSAQAGLDVDFHLHRRHFEHAHEAWAELRSSELDPDRYAEEPQDGRSHVRSQLLWDYLSLLNHDLAGVDDPDGDDYAFVKRRSWDELGATEIAELDSLAALLSRDPQVEELVAFYRATPAVRVAGAEHDPHSFVYSRIPSL